MLAGIWMAVGSVAVGCGDKPCQELSEKICRCGRTEAEQQRCVRQVGDASPARAPSAREEEQCAALLDSCTCAKLSDGELAACGLARE